MRRKRHKLARHERVPLLITRDAQRRAVEKRRQVERHERVEDNDLVRRVGVDGVVEREVGARVVEGDVQRRRRVGVLVRETRDEFLEIALALGGCDGGPRAVVVVE